MDLKKVDLDIEILGYGPQLITHEKELDPQTIIAFSSMMTYKSKNVKEMINEIAKAERDIDQITKKSLMSSAARGHASLSTSAAVWILFTGASKFVDSLFTGTTFSSSLMPSGRRIPADLESIIAPESIYNADEETKKIFYETSKKNIDFYQELIANKIPKEDAAKITQYGIRGGGFMLLPLETIIELKQEFEAEKEFVPKEGHDFINLIENKLKDLGMDILYWARYFAPRNTYPYPNIFTDPKKTSYVSHMQWFYPNRNAPFIFKHSETDTIIGKEYNTALFRSLLHLKSVAEDIKKDQNSVYLKWRDLLNARRDISKRFKTAISISSISDVSWRVWGEIKRHRTLQQEVESVYSAAERASNELLNNLAVNNAVSPKDGIVLHVVESVFTVPDIIKTNIDYAKRWVECLRDSLHAYNKLKERVPISDAISVIPRGLKLSVIKNFDLWNILDGYVPLRLCGTAETEMRENTEREAENIRLVLPPAYGHLVGPKCHAVGFCLESFDSYKKCGRINQGIDFKYTEEFHNKMHDLKESMINSNLQL